MLYELKSWVDGRVLFSLECGSLKLCVEAAAKSSADLRYADLSYANLRQADLRYANLSYANLRQADLRQADLRYADLRYANLRYANLSYADLSYANLRSAHWPKGAAVLRPPIQIWGLRWPVTIFGSHMQIGCEVHAIREWETFDDRRIVEMAGRDGLEFWQANKSRLLAFRDTEAEEAFANTQQAAPEPAAT